MITMNVAADIDYLLQAWKTEMTSLNCYLYWNSLVSAYSRLHIIAAVSDFGICLCSDACVSPPEAVELINGGALSTAHQVLTLPRYDGLWKEGEFLTLDAEGLASLPDETRSFHEGIGTVRCLIVNFAQGQSAVLVETLDS